ncbi:hypothetical protein Esti_004515 [Eimeria stiedai]
MRFRPSFPLPGLFTDCLRAPPPPHHCGGPRGPSLNAVRTWGPTTQGMGIPLNPQAKGSSSSGSKLCRRSLSSSSSNSRSGLVAFGELRDRWFVAYKPPGWSVGPLPGVPSLSEHLEDALTRQALSEAAAAAAAASFAAKAPKAAAAAATATLERASFRKLHFPQQRLPVEAQGLLLVATDEGACKAIRRLIANGEVEERYHVLAEIPQSTKGGLRGRQRGPSHPMASPTTEGGGALQEQHQKQQESCKRQQFTTPSSRHAADCFRGPPSMSPVGGSVNWGPPLGPLEAAAWEGGPLPEGILCSERQRKPSRAPRGASFHEVFQKPSEGGPSPADDSTTDEFESRDVKPLEVSSGVKPPLAIAAIHGKDRRTDLSKSCHPTETLPLSREAWETAEFQFAAAGCPLLNDQHYSSSSNKSSNNSSGSDRVSCSDRSTIGIKDSSSKYNNLTPEDPYGVDAGGPMEEEGHPRDEEGGLLYGSPSYDSLLGTPDSLNCLFSISHAGRGPPQQQTCSQQQEVPLAAAAVPSFDILSSSSSSSRGEELQAFSCVSLGLQLAALSFPDPLSPRTGTLIRVSVDLPPDWTAAI